jgi:hypothetical protein
MYIKRVIESLYDLIAVEVEVLSSAARDPDSIVQSPAEQHKLKLKVFGNFPTILDVLISQHGHYVVFCTMHVC